MFQEISYKYFVNKKTRVRSLVNNYLRYKFTISELKSKCLKIKYLSIPGFGNPELLVLENQSIKIGLIDKIRFGPARSYVCKFFVGVSAFLSCAVMLGEVLLLTDYDFSFLRENFEKFNFLSFLLGTMIPYYYIVFCVYWSFFNLNIDGFVGLHKKNTDSQSMIFYIQ